MIRSSVNVFFSSPGPTFRGKVVFDAPMKAHTWLRVGGPADAMFSPADADDLALFLSTCPKDMPLTVLGVGSNLLVRDGGIRGIVIKLSPAFAKITVEGETIKAGASALDTNIARTAKDASLTGLEFLHGIPGALGGALRMNAGAHGQEIKDVVTSITYIDRQGRINSIGPEVMGFSYRKSTAPEDWVFLEATLKAKKGTPEEIEERMKAVGAARAAQPTRQRTAGSTFANPEGHKAWELIDKAGCRGLRVGGAIMSELHCNFMINSGDATASDLETLGETVRRRVKEMSGIDLRWEVRIIGEPAYPEQGGGAP